MTWYSKNEGDVMKYYESAMNDITWSVEMWSTIGQISILTGEEESSEMWYVIMIPLLTVMTAYYYDYWRNERIMIWNNMKYERRRNCKYYWWRNAIFYDEVRRRRWMTIISNYGSNSDMTEENDEDEGHYSYDQLIWRSENEDHIIIHDHEWRNMRTVIQCKWRKTCMVWKYILLCVLRNTLLYY